MKYCFCLAIVGGFILGIQVHAQSTAKYSNEFLKIGVGARALGMGNTQVAAVRDVTSGYWNPAGLLEVRDKYQFALMHSEQFGGIAKYDYAGFATPIDSVSALGVSVIRFAVDDIPDTRFLYDANGAINYNNIRFFNAADYAFLFSYARRLPILSGLRLGGNFKVIYRNVGNFANAWGFGIDAGAQLRVRSWQFGLMWRDVTSTFNAWTHNEALIADTYAQTGNTIPQNSVELTLPSTVLGIAKEFSLSPVWGGLLTLDWNLTFDGARNVLLQSEILSADPGLGIEFNYQKMIFLRGGINNTQQIKNFDGTQYWQSQFSFGAGIQLKNITIDYALTRNNTDRNTSALYSNIFSLKVGLQGKKLQ